MDTKNDLLSILGTARELQEILKETPEILTLVEALREVKDTSRLLGIAKDDKLLTTAEVCKMLKISKSRVYEYVKKGHLKPVCTPESSRLKFWVSEVKRVPVRGGTDDGLQD